MGESAGDVVIAGGGFAGLAMGAALASIGHRVVVLEARNGPMRTFRGELLHPRAVRQLEALELSESLIPLGAQEVSGFAAFDGAEGEPVVLPYGSDHGSGLGLEHAMITAAFEKKLTARDDALVLARARVEGLLRDGERVVGLRCANGQDYRADLVIAADGRHSRVREMLGIAATSTLLSYTVALSVDGSALPLPGHGHVLVGGPGPILAYPYGPGLARMCIDVPTGVTGKGNDILGYVRDRYAAFLPERLRKAMLSALSAATLGGSANHEIATRTCAVPGAALVGDAAGCSHPLTATGMTTALHDVATLTSCIRESGLTTRALVSYQKRRYWFVRTREIFAHALYEVCRRQGPGPQALCDGMFRYWRGSERARHASMSILSGDESSALGFMAEYARVVGISVADTFANAARKGNVGGVARPLGGLMATAGECLDLAIGKAWSTLSLKGKRGLQPLPNQDA